MVSVHGVEGRMTAGGDQGDERRLQVWVGQVSGGDVAFQVVHGDERERAGVGECLSPPQTPTRRAPIKPGLTVTATLLDFFERDPGVGEGLLDHPV